MKIGTKSLLFGVHCFFLHPFFVAMAWRRLYGFPFSFQLWTCFFFHDIGYWGKADMDGPNEGQRHPELGARLVRRFLGNHWGDFCLYHSRFYAMAESKPTSQLCSADKLAFCCYPCCLYLFLGKITGELELYKTFSTDNKEFEGNLSDREWFFALRRYTLKVTAREARKHKLYKRAEWY